MAHGLKGHSSLLPPAHALDFNRAFARRISPAFAHSRCRVFRDGRTQTNKQNENLNFYCTGIRTRKLPPSATLEALEPLVRTHKRSIDCYSTLLKTKVYFVFLTIGRHRQQRVGHALTRVLLPPLRRRHL